jgi:hypothetical protein
MFGRTVEIDGVATTVLISTLSPSAAQTYAPFAEISSWDRPIFQCLCAPGSYATGDQIETPEFMGVIECIEEIYVGNVLALQRLILRTLPTGTPF